MADMNAGRSTPPVSPSPAFHAGYDASGVHVGGVVRFIAGFALSLGILLFVVWIFQAEVENIGETPPVAAPMLDQPLQPSSGHSTLDWQDLAALRSRQEAQLHGSDPERHQIPIDRAMDELLKSGMLTRPWVNPATQPFMRPPAEPTRPSVENRT